MIVSWRICLPLLGEGQTDRETDSQSICFQTHSRPFTPSYMRSYPLLLHTRENTRSVSNLSTNSPATPTCVATPRPQHDIVVGLFLTLYSFFWPPQQGQTDLYMIFFNFFFFGFVLFEEVAWMQGNAECFFLPPAAVACCVCALVFRSGQKLADRLSRACRSQRWPHSRSIIDLTPSEPLMWYTRLAVVNHLYQPWVTSLPSWRDQILNVILFPIPVCTVPFWFVWLTAVAWKWKRWTNMHTHARTHAYGSPEVTHWP